MTNSNNTVNITVNDYGQENVNYLKDSKYKRIINKILGNGMLGLQQYIKFKYCNPEAPENLTIKYTNKRHKDIYVRTDNTWEVRNKHEVMDELYDRDKNVEEVLGSAPIPPVSKDFITSMGRTNDAILYGGEVHLNVKGKDDELENLAKNLPSSSSKDYGKPLDDFIKQN